MKKFILSCEHGGNKIPEGYKECFIDAKSVLNTHKGIDFGTLDLFKELHSYFDYSHSNDLCRLLIEFNRSLHHPKLFSEYSAQISKKEKENVIETFYNPYRKGFVDFIDKSIKNQIIHLSLHSFTPVLHSEIRNADIGLLYDPSKKQEKEVAKVFKKILSDLGYKVRFNYPYLGTADGFTSYLRKLYPQKYSGIELEINQKFADNDVFQKAIKKDIKYAILKLISTISE